MGISAYKVEAGEKISDLTYAETDALEFTVFLEQNAGFTNDNYHVVYIPGSRASAKYVKETFTRVASRANAGDSVVFFFSGHGGAIDKGHTYIRCYDHLLALQELFNVPCASANVFFFVDACRTHISDASTRDMNVQADRQIRKNYEQARKDAEHLYDKTPAKLFPPPESSLLHAAIFYACQDNASAYESNGKRQGAFTRILLDSLQQWHSDHLTNELTASWLDTTLHMYTSEWNKRNRIDAQAPEFIGNHQAVLDTRYKSGVVTATGIPPILAAYWHHMISVKDKGPVIIGSNGGSTNDDEQLSHRVSISDFSIGQTEVTVAMWKEYCSLTGKRMPPPPPFNPSWMYENHPICEVTWCEAAEYCLWANHCLNKRVTLPTEAQWEKAARGGDGREFPWGQKFDKIKIAYQDGRSDKADGTEDVNTRQAGQSPYKVLGMAGNLREWCWDVYRTDAYSTTAYTEPDPCYDPQYDALYSQTSSPDPNQPRVVRGGSWADQEASAFRCARRYSQNANRADDQTGFRLCIGERSFKDYPNLNSDHSQ